MLMMKVVHDGTIGSFDVQEEHPENNNGQLLLI
jgi:hypothetical protein